MDCAGVCDGDSIADDCGVCDGDGSWCAEATISLGAVNGNSLEVNYSSQIPLLGFQFDVSGVTLTGASGGAAEDAEFEVSVGSSTVLGFSFTGGLLPESDGNLLTNLDAPAINLCVKPAAI